MNYGYACINETLGAGPKKTRIITGVEECHGKINYYRSDGSRAQVRVWWVKEYDDEPAEYAIQDVKNDIPF